MVVHFPSAMDMIIDEITLIKHETIFYQLILKNWNRCPLFIVSVWLLFNANSAIFQLYHGENKLISNNMMMRSPLYYTNTHSLLFFIVVFHWNNSPRIDMFPYSDTLSWFRSKQSSLFLLDDACLVEKQQIPII